MTTLIVRSAGLMGAGIFLLLGSCGTTAGSGGGAISTKIDLAPRYNVERAAVTVFRAEGFQMVRRDSAGIGFARVGDATTQKNFGDWFGPGVSVRAEVRVKELEFGRHELQCVPYVQEGSGLVPTLQGSSRFKTLMKRIKQLAEVL